MQPSEEQQRILTALHEGANVTVDAVAGSGKSTVVLMAAAAMPERRFLQITYNSMLRKEVQEKIGTWHLSEKEKPALRNIEVHTYHSLAVNYYDPAAHKDEVIQRLLIDGSPQRPVPWIDVLVLDEIQDMTFLYFRLVAKMLRDMQETTGRKRGLQLLILGDTKQSLYEFKGADVRFLTMAAALWKNYPLLRRRHDFRALQLHTSYRVTHSMAHYVNRVMLGEERLQANKEGCPVKYVYGSQYDNEKRVVAHIQRILDRGHPPDDIFVLAASVKNEFGPVRKLENRLVERGIPCYVPRHDQDRLEEQRVIQGKVVFATFHSVKGRQRPFVFVLGFDSSYMQFASNEHECPNTLYVACTRGSQELYLFEEETYGNRKRMLPFLKMGHRDMESQSYIDFVGTPRGPMWYVTQEQQMQREQEQKQQEQKQQEQKQQEQQEQPKQPQKTKYVEPSKMVDFLGHEILDVLAPLVQRSFHLLTKESEVLDMDVPSLIETGPHTFEDVTDINSIAFPCLFYATLPSYPPTTLYDITQRSLQQTKDNQYLFLKQHIQEHMPRQLTVHSPTEDVLRAANMYVAVREKLCSKLTQVSNYGWIRDDKRAEGIRRLQQWIEVDEDVQVEQELVNSHKTDDDEKQERLQAALQDCVILPRGPPLYLKFTARVDALTKTHLWEFKFVAELTTEHFLQLMIYAWIWRTLNPADTHKRYCLFNIRTNEVHELQADDAMLHEVVVLLLRNRFGEPERESDDLFLAKGRNTWVPAVLTPG